MFNNRPTMTEDEMVRRLVRGDTMLDINEITPDLSIDETLKALPRGHPMRVQLESAIDARRNIDTPIPRRPLPERSLATQFFDYIDRTTGRNPNAGRTTDTRSPLQRAQDAADNVSANVSRQKANLAEAERTVQFYEEQLADQRRQLSEGRLPPDVVGRTERDLNDARELAERQRTLVADAEAVDKGSVRRIAAEEAFDKADEEIRKAHGRAIEDPFLRDLVNRRVNRRVRTARALRTGGKGLLGLTVLGGVGATGYLINKRTQEELDGALLVNRALTGQLTDEDMEALVDEFGEEGAAEFLNEAQAAQEEGIDLEALGEEMPEDGEEPEQPPPSDDAGLDEAEPILAPLPTERPEIIEASAIVPAPEEPPAPSGEGEAQYRGENPFEYLDENQARILGALAQEGMTGQDILDMFNEGTRDYFFEGIEDISPELVERYLGNENLLGDNAVLRAGDAALDWMRTPVGEMAADAGLEAEPGSVAGAILNSPAARAYDFAREVLIPQRTDFMVRNPLEIGADMFTAGSQSEAVRDAVGPLIREYRGELGLDPMEEQVGAVPMPGDVGSAAMDAEAFADMDSVTPTVPNDFNNPQTYADLKHLENIDMLPYANLNAIENAELLGIEIPRQVQRLYQDYSQPEGGFAAPPDVPEDALPAEGAGLDGPTSTITVDEAVDEVLGQDEVQNPRGQFTPEVDDNFSIEPFSIEEPEELMADVQVGAPPRRSLLPIGPAYASTMEDPVGRMMTPELAGPTAEAAPQIDTTPYIERPSSDTAITTGSGAPTPVLTGGETGTQGAVGDFGGSQTGDIAGLAEDAEAAEEQLNAINRWMADRGMDPDERSAAADALIRMGATMMMTPGNFGEALGAGLSAGLDEYSGALDTLQDRALAEQEAAMRAQEFQLAQSLGQQELALNRMRIEGGGDEGITDLDKYYRYLQIVENSPISAEMTPEQQRDLARAAAGLRGEPSTDLLEALLRGDV